MMDSLKEYLKNNHAEFMTKEFTSPQLLEVDYTNLQNTLEEYDIQKYEDHEYVLEQLRLLVNKGKEDEPISVCIVEVPPTVELREIDAKDVGKFFSTTVMIKTITEINLNLSIQRYRCTNCNKIYTMDLRGGVEAVVPTKCSCGCKDFEFDQEESVFQNEKYLTLEEPLESRRNGLTRRFTAHLTGYEASSAYNLKAGDVCEANGRVEAQKPLKGKKEDWNFMLELNHIKPIGYSFDDLELSEEDIKEVEELSRNPDIFEMFRDSIAPSVYGFKSIKEGAVLQLFEGNKANDTGGSRGRSCIHILIVGEPGLGKSEFANSIPAIAPKVIAASGANSSHAGLTVSTNRDELTGKWSAEAGAIVLADSGLLVIDEFDKLSDETQKGLNEPMENQTASISKAGLVQTMSARTSVLAIANPKDGVFKDNGQLTKQLDMPASTLSRFDLVYVMKDVVDGNRDHRMAEHILTQDNEPSLPVIDNDLARKYIAHAKASCKPVLSDSAKDLITNFYVETRQVAEEDGDSKAITPRDLQAIKRLSIAYCKLHLRDEVTEDDAREAIRIYAESLETMGLTPITAGMVADEFKSKSELECQSRFEELLIDELDEYGKLKNIPSERIDAIKNDVGVDYEFRDGVLDDLFNEARFNIKMGGYENG